MFTGMRDKRLVRVNYKLNRFSYCRVLNDRVRCASLIRDEKYYYNRDGYIQEHIHLQDDVVKHDNRPCYSPLVAIRRWKWWLPELNRRKFRNVIPCFTYIYNL